MNAQQRFPVTDLLPHRGPALLIDEVLEAGERTLSARVFIRPGIPYFEDGKGVPAHVGIEYMAQACGAFAGWRARISGEPVQRGFLLGTRGYRAKMDWFAPGETLTVTTAEVLVDGNIGVFDCVIRSQGAELAAARLTVYQSTEKSGLAPERIAGSESLSRTVLVTGASKGIGRAIAARLGRDGFRVILHYHSDRAGAEEALAAIRAGGGEGALLGFDISDRGACRAIIEEDIEANGPYYGAVLNAGIARDAVFPAMAEADWDAVLGTNLDGFYNVLHPVVLPMIAARKGGRIVTLSSVSGLAGNRGQVNYSAAKAGIIGATKALAMELAGRRITVNCVAPGVIETRMTAGLPMEEVLKLIPLRRAGQPEEVAAAVSFLCSDEAGYVTRQVLSVNGGMM